MRKLKSLRFVLLIVLLVIAINPVYGQAEEGKVVVPPGETIKVGLAIDQTGPIAEFGVDVRRGAENALAQLNEAGGIKGWEVEFIVEDTRCDSNEGTLVANRNVANPEIVAIVGHMCSGSTIAASDIYEEARIPMMSPSATNPDVTERGLDVMNRVAFRDDMQGMVDAHYLYKVLGVRKLAVMHDNEAYGLGLAEFVRDNFVELGGEVVAFEGINVEDQDFRNVLTLIGAEEPEAIFFGGYNQQAILLVPQKADVGLEDVIFFSCDGIYGPAFIDGAGEFAEGVYASFAEAGEVSEEALEAYYARAESLFGISRDDLSSFHLFAYDSASTIFAAIDAVSVVDDNGNLVIDREELIKALRSTENFEGLTGTLTCDEIGDCSASSISINLVEGSEWIRVELPEDLLAVEE